MRSLASVLARRHDDEPPAVRPLTLISQFFKSPQAVGTIVPSTRNLAEAMIAPLDFAALKTIVECGPGTGAITGPVAERLSGQSRYIGIEINATFCKNLAVRFPHLTFVNRSAVEIEDVIRAAGIERADAVLCGIPWASLPAEQQTGILDGVKRILAPGGVFVTYAYLQGLLLPGAWALRRNLKERFSSVATTRIVWNNVPPAFAYICRP
ncbi:MAG TPA: methyltransferase domain-containing protein [Alphaproteobacteria bacterium]|nr:methyltransferase domain-containing protein [Alphaproteobacteria bacterium]